MLIGKVIKEFVDRHTKEFFRPGDTYQAGDQERLDELIDKGYVEADIDGRDEAKGQKGKKQKQQAAKAQENLAEGTADAAAGGSPQSADQGPTDAGADGQER